MLLLTLVKTNITLTLSFVFTLGIFLKPRLRLVKSVSNRVGPFLSLLRYRAVRDRLKWTMIGWTPSLVPCLRNFLPTRCGRLMTSSTLSLGMFEVLTASLTFSNICSTDSLRPFGGGGISTICKFGGDHATPDRPGGVQIDWIGSGQPSHDFQDP